MAMLAEMGNHLHAGRPVSNHAYALTGQIDGSIPLGCMHRATGEAFEPLYIGNLWMMQHACRHDRDMSAVLVPVLGLDIPMIARPDHAGDFAVEGRALMVR